MIIKKLLILGVFPSFLLNKRRVWHPNGFISFSFHSFHLIHLRRVAPRLPLAQNSGKKFHALTKNPPPLCPGLKMTAPIRCSAMGGTISKVYCVMLPTIDTYNGL